MDKDIDTLLDDIDKAQAKRSEDMPTDKDALLRMFECVQRLKELGWNDAIYCPKDGTIFDAIESGSSGIHKAHYDGKWPEGNWWVHSEGDLWPSRPILFKLIKK
jgi:hypothetical protein